MNEIKFYKYHGAGNDFILINTSETDETLFTNSRVEQMCSRRTGIGADGLILISATSEADFRMRYFNSDGKESTMCGNGGRCAVAMARHIDLIKSNTTQFIASDGPHYAEILDNNMIRLKMKDIAGIEERGDYYFIDSGSPHVVIMVDDPDSVDVVELGRKIRYNYRFFKEGTNVNFVSLCEADSMKVRTYERGVEDETLSCGTGAVASAAFCSFIAKKPGQYKKQVIMQGGTLYVDFEYDGSQFRNVFLTGPAEFVFQGFYPAEK